MAARKEAVMPVMKHGLQKKTITASIITWLTERKL